MKYNQKVLAELIAEMLIAGISQHPCLDAVSIADLRMVFRERAANIAQAMPELLAEATPPKWVAESLASAKNAKEVIDRQLEHVFGGGREPGESLP